MLENLEKYKIILCSNSPRRRELLSGLGLNFEVRVIDNIDESYNNNNRCEEIAEEISLKKADTSKIFLTVLHFLLQNFLCMVNKCFQN